MNRNQSESIERVDETKPRARRSLAAIGDVDDASERAFASRTARTTERRNRRNRRNRANARSRGKSTHTKIRGSRLVNHDSHRAGPFFPARTRARGFDRNQRRFLSIESNDVFGSIGDLTRSNLSIDRRCSFVFPRDSRARSRQNRLIRSMFARRRAVAAATRCAARSFV
jgi:hypothetical protein